MSALTELGIIGVLRQADAVQHLTAVVLVLMSLASWCVMFMKACELWRLRARSALLSQVMEPESRSSALKVLGEAERCGPFSILARRAMDLSQGRDAGHALDSEVALREFERVVRRSVKRLESGLGVLASVGATAPFVGLFGTVWGIYRALIGIGVSGQATIDKVAGPVGEALIMTAFGLAVAIPAVLAYNFLVRANRGIVSELDEFVQDLMHLVLLSGRTPARPGA
jgi:biopolymer transport protein ExbB